LGSQSEDTKMSLCLALLLAAIAIDWWQGWKPFEHRFQMPGEAWRTRLTIHSQRRRSSPPSIVDAREPPSAVLGGSHQQRQLHELAQSGSGIDLLKDFSEVAREELRAFTTL
jgi:hypothetical protein